MAGGRVDVRPVASLLPHEDIIAPQVEKLAAAMRRHGVQRDPLIVDRESGTVLDGMHRLAAFRKMGAEYAVCYLVDDSSKSITLQRWVRVLTVSKTSLVPHVLENLGVDRKGSPYPRSLTSWRTEALWPSWARAAVTSREFQFPTYPRCSSGTEDRRAGRSTGME